MTAALLVATHLSIRSNCTILGNVAANLPGGAAV
jgi:hypothetical protein